MWGYANILNRKEGFRVYEEFISTSTQNQFNAAASNPKYLDQSYLSSHVWPFARTNATVHDSYTCAMFGGEPFPTRRSPDMYCFVSCFYPCCDLKYNQTARMPPCPAQCRPKEHPEWDTC